MVPNTAVLIIDLGWLFVMKTEKYKQKRTKNDTKHTNPLHPLPSPNSVQSPIQSRVQSMFSNWPSQVYYLYGFLPPLSGQQIIFPSELVTDDMRW